MERSRHSQRHRHHRNHHNRSPSPKLLHETKTTVNDFRHDRYRDHGPQRDLDHQSSVQTWLQHTEFPGQEHVEERGKLAAPDRSIKTSWEYRRPASADSSIIAALVPHREHASTHQTIQKPKESKQKDVRSHRKNRKRKRRSPSLQSQSTDEPKQEKTTYEKRARHKTREDKYEPYHGGPAHSKPVEAASGNKALRSASKEKEKTRGKRKSTGLATSRELMGKFHSDAIHNERLTMLPSMHVGIFNNSKHGKAPGDLAFGEMSFLKEARPGETTKSAPKTRSLESRKRDQKELENIEVFFSHKKHEDNHSRTTKQARHRGIPMGEPGLTDNMSHPAGGSSRVSPSSRATTYFSWSSSNQPPHVIERQDGGHEPRKESALEQALEKRTSCLRDESTTPDPIRQKLIETGIYRCLPHLKPQWPSTKDPSLPELHEKNNDNSEPPRRSEEPGSHEAPFSRAHIAQQAYIRPRIRAPQIPLKKQIVASRELLTLQEPSLAEPPPVSERPPETCDRPLSHGRVLDSRGLSPVLEDRSVTDPAPHVQQQLPGSAMMHSPDDISTLRHTAQLPTCHYNSRYAMGAFKSISSISSHYPFDARGWQMITHSDVRSPYRLSTGRGSTLHPASPYGGSISQGRSDAYSETVRRQSMHDYIADLEEKTFDVGGSDRGGVECRPLQPEIPVMQTEPEHVPMLAPTAQQSFEQMAWEQDPAAHSAYEANTPLSPANPYSIPGYELVAYGQNEQIPRGHMAGPSRPGTAMSSSMMDRGLYWKPNTYGL